MGLPIVSSQTADRFRRWFWRPPRTHGDVILDRRVSDLELFYDLVYVVVISQATHRLAEEITLRSVLEFTIIFSMIVVAWVNGSFYLELHGRGDGRTRSLVFVQMGVLAVLAVYTGTATGDGGQAFALVYAVFLLVMTWAWNSVRLEDRRWRPEFLALTGRYLILLVGSIAVLLVSAFLSPEVRLIVWAGYSATWLVGFWVLDRFRGGLPIALAPTDSLVERFGLFVIIVLGEVVIGVVDGMSQAEHDFTTIGTGVIALLVGFGLWWIYFDLVGHRLPRMGQSVVDWVLSHFPITLSIAAQGPLWSASSSTPTRRRRLSKRPGCCPGPWPSGCSHRSWPCAHWPMRIDSPSVYLPMSWALAGGAVGALALALLDPAPWLFAFGMAALLSVLWSIAVALFIRADAWARRSALTKDADCYFVRTGEERSVRRPTPAGPGRPRSSTSAPWVACSRMPSTDLRRLGGPKAWSRQGSCSTSWGPLPSRSSTSGSRSSGRVGRSSCWRQWPSPGADQWSGHAPGASSGWIPAEIAGGQPTGLPPPEDLPPGSLSSVWPGGYVASLDVRFIGEPRPGRGTAWIRTPLQLVASEETSELARFVALVDTANGVGVRVSPRSWFYPNVDLSIHFYRQPTGPWVGLDTEVAFGPQGQGLTSTTLHDRDGPVGRAEQTLTIRHRD